MKGKKYTKKRIHNKATNTSNNTEQITNIKKLPFPKIPYVNNINKELELNKLNNNCKYIIINHSRLIDHAEVNTINIYITKFNNWKGLIPKNSFDVTDITKDSNCLFRAIVNFFRRRKPSIRNIIYNYILLNKNDEIFTASYIQDNLNIIDIEEYLGKIKIGGSFCGDLEIILISKIFNVSIYVFQYIEPEETYRFLYKHENQKEFIFHCIILNHTYTDLNAEHFELLTKYILM